jgi:hypothetical protein
MADRFTRTFRKDQAMKKIKFMRTALAGAILMGVGSTASAVTLEGATMWFSFDETQLNPLFGGFKVQKLLDGVTLTDTLRFDPSMWVAEAGIGTIPFTNLSIKNATTPSISVTAKEGYVLTGASLHEQGDYLRLGALGEVAVTGQFILNDAPIGITAGPLTALTTISTLATTEWELDASGNLSGVDGSIKLQNILVAGSLDPGAFRAFIEKKLIQISVNTQATVVPLPPAAWMLGSALVGLVTVGRRKLGV